MTEINNRTDWRVTSTPTAYYNKSSIWPDDTTSAVANWTVLPAYSSLDFNIEFLGGELYHFRFASQGHGYCSYTAELMVYTYGAEILTFICWMTVANVIMVILIAFIVFYYLRYRQSGLRFLK